MSESTNVQAGTSAGSTSLGGLAQAALITAAMTSAINLGAANIALVEIGRAMDASSYDLTLIGACASVGMGSAVLYFGRLSQSIGRARVIQIGLVLSIVLSVASAAAPGPYWLAATRLGIGFCCALVYPSTLAVIAADTSGAARNRAIGRWFGFSIGAAALGPVVGGLLLSAYWWGAAFLVSLPVAMLALLFSIQLPRSAGEDHAPVDHLDGVGLMMGVLLLSGVLSSGGTSSHPVLVALAFAAAATILFFAVRRQAVGPHPLFDFRVARRPTFWPAATAGSVTVGSMLAAFFVGQQYMQHTLGYTTAMAGLAILPTGLAILVVSPRAAKAQASRGTRSMLLLGIAIVMLGLASMLMWTPERGYLPVGLTYLALGVAVGIVGPTVSRALMASVSGEEIAMGSATSDLQACIGGALLIPIFGSTLATAYQHAFETGILAAAPESIANLSMETLAASRASLTGAETAAARLSLAPDAPHLQIASQAFVAAVHWSIGAGLVALAVCAALVALVTPDRRTQRSLEAIYSAGRA